MNFKDPKSMNDVLSSVLRYGVLISAVIIAVGAFLFVAQNSSQDASTLTYYHSNRVPHGDYDVNLGGIAAGLLSLKPFPVIELGFLVLLATPVMRVALSIALFAAEGDRKYVYVTAAVLSMLLFSILATPFIPVFGGV